MTLLIAHRGLLDGPDPDLENSPTSVELARRLGHDVEIDLWKVDDEWYLGHDGPQYRTELDWLKSVDRTSYLDSHHAWLHAKNIDALHGLCAVRWEGHFFYHQTDDAVITSTGYLWTNPGKQLTPLSICVMPEMTDAIDRIADLKVAGICTDYVRKIEHILR